MLTENELYVVVKLVSGENVMAILSAEDEEHIMLETPMCIRTTPILHARREHVTVSPLCQFSDDTSFMIDKKNVMYVKKLHQVFIRHYQKMVLEHENIVPFDSKTDSDPERVEEKDFYFVAGNETIN